MESEALPVVGLWRIVPAHRCEAPSALPHSQLIPHSQAPSQRKAAYQQVLTGEGRQRHRVSGPHIVYDNREVNGKKVLS